jgi:hypothetical protein
LAAMLRRGNSAARFIDMVCHFRKITNWENSNRREPVPGISGLRYRQITLSRIRVNLQKT